MATTAMTFVPVGNPDNANDAADSNGLAFGKVDYQYNMGTSKISRFLRLRSA
jgi:hypothetical protein